MELGAGGAALSQRLARQLAYYLSDEGAAASNYARLSRSDPRAGRRRGRQGAARAETRPAIRAAVAFLRASLAGPCDA